MVTKVQGAAGLAGSFNWANVIVVIEIFDGVVETVWGFFDLDKAQSFIHDKRLVHGYNDTKDDSPQDKHWKYVIEGVKQP